MENGKLQKKSYDLDMKDFFWSSNATRPFPQVAENIDTELSKYAPMSDVCSKCSRIALGISEMLLR